MKETWKPVYQSSGRYLISDTGRVRSCVYRGKQPRLMAPQKGKREGRWSVMLRYRRGSKPICKQISTLVLQAFVGPRPRGLQCAHLDGNVDNNRLKNLAWVTPVENNQHKQKHGTQIKGVQHYKAVLNDALVRELRQQAKHKSIVKIAREHGISYMTVYSAVTKRNWRHVR